MNFYQDLIEKAENIDNKKQLNQLKVELLRKYNLEKIPSNGEILSHLNSKDKERFKLILTKKPIRTGSGVAPIALMTKPEKCKHGTCIFCPGGPGSVFGDTPQSYTGKEPSTRRAIRNDFDPYLQVMNRLEQYIISNHMPEKTELIIQGGTFPCYDIDYQNSFITYCLKAMNDFSEIFFQDNELNFSKFKKFFLLPGNIRDESRKNEISRELLLKKGESTLEKEQLRNETSKIRCTALVVETKPDYCTKEHINQMLKLGTTRIELGVQTLYNDILKSTNRGHTVENIQKALQLLKDSFLKVTYHVMLGLPGSSKEKDLKMFKELFDNQLYRPDSLKIYPCLVLKGTALYELYKQGKFKPISTQDAISLILEMKKFVPEYTRIMRINRDIPSNMVESGIDITNLRQKVHENKKFECKCIRCREPKQVNFDNVKLIRRDYESTNGEEIFLSFEEGNNLLGFTRLRIPYKPFRKEITGKTAGIRELHVYGKSISLGKQGEIQHKGYGSRLIKEAEKIAKEEFGMNKLAIISGIGVRKYYYNLGYNLDGIYVSKELK